MTAFPHGFNRLAVRNIPVLTTPAGTTFWVDSGIGSNANDGTLRRPFGTIDYAIGRCAANNGDVIMVAPGHAETISAAAGIDFDVAGITVIGMGEGRDRPTITWSATAATMHIDAANTTIKNMILDVTGIDAVVLAMDVDKADFTLEGCDVIMSITASQATEFIVTATAANRMRVIGNVFRSLDVGANNAISIEGTPDGIEIGWNRIYGDFADACIHNPTGNVATNVSIHNNYLQNNQAGDHAIELVSAVTGEFYRNRLVTDAIATAATLGALFNADNFYSDNGATDAAAVPFPETVTTGGSSLSQVADRLGADADTDAIGALLSGTAGIATMPSAAVPANGVNMFEMIRDIWGSLVGTAAGENGVQTFPAAAAAANNVSIAEVVRYVSEIQTARVAIKTISNAAITLTTGASPVTAFTVTGDVYMRVWGTVQTLVTSTLNNGTLAVGVTAATGVFLAATTADGTQFPTGGVWIDTTPALKAEVFVAANLTWVAVVNTNVIITVATNSMTAGALTLYCQYVPLSVGATVVAA